MAARKKYSFKVKWAENEGKYISVMFLGDVPQLCRRNATLDEALRWVADQMNNANFTSDWKELTIKLK